MEVEGLNNSWEQERKASLTNFKSFQTFYFAVGETDELSEVSGIIAMKWLRQDFHTFDGLLAVVVLGRNSLSIFVSNVHVIVLRTVFYSIPDRLHF